MCGITGYIDFTSTSTSSVLDKMTDSLAHRGPDGRGTFFEQKDSFQVGLGHRRLAILELSELGKQPMQWNEFTIVFNGEIYNFQEIRAELINLGHTFQALSDTEVILHAYQQWGTTCLEKFIGMFAFVLYDNQNRELFIARDRAGVKPLFIYQKDGLLLFASELKAFHEHPNFQKKISIAAVHAFLHYGNVPTPHCIFEDAFKVKPGHFLLLKLNSEVNSLSLLRSLSLSKQQQQYWNVYDAYNKPKLKIEIPEAKLETERILQRACEYRMVADVPVGVFLSGGYDSTCVTSLLQKERTSPLHTYTISVPDIGLNEAPFAKQIAKHLGTTHTETECSPQEAIDLIGTLPFHYDEPFADSSAIPTMLVSKIARQEVTVALSADAGDEVFAGYNRYEMMLKYGNKLQYIPPFLQRGMAGIMDKIPAHQVPHFKNKYNFPQRYEKIKSILNNSSTENIMLSITQLFTKGQIQQLTLHEITTLETYYESKELIQPTTLNYIMAIDYQTYLIDDILQKVDRASMAVGLESREPFLDHRVIEWAAQLPDNYKYRDGIKKWILKEIVHQYVPKNIMDRPKMGFAIPIESWLQLQLREQVETYLSEERIVQQGIFRWEEIARLKKLFFSGRNEYGVKIWYLVSFQMWHERWA